MHVFSEPFRAMLVPAEPWRRNPERQRDSQDEDHLGDSDFRNGLPLQE